MENNKMKKLLSLFAAIVVLSGCSSLGGMFGGAECDSKLARDFMANAEDRVFFAFDSNEVNVIVQGYCDERGTREYNLALGERRANAVKQYLISQGIAADRISTISYGKERPAVLGNNEAAWAQNRRAVTVVKAGN